MFRPAPRSPAALPRGAAAPLEHLGHRRPLPPLDALGYVGLPLENTVRGSLLFNLSSRSLAFLIWMMFMAAGNSGSFSSGPKGIILTISLTKQLSTAFVSAYINVRLAQPQVKTWPTEAEAWWRRLRTLAVLPL